MAGKDDQTRLRKGTCEDLRGMRGTRKHRGGDITWGHTKESKGVNVVQRQGI